MNGIDQSIQIIRQEMDVKLRHMGAEFTDTLDQIHTALEGITKGSRMAFDVVRMDLEDQKKRVARLEELLLAQSTQVIPENADTVSGSIETSQGKEL